MLEFLFIVILSFICLLRTCINQHNDKLILLQKMCLNSILDLENLRLIEDEERRWTDENVDAVAQKNFPNINREAALCRPILFSNWLSKDYIPVERERLREYVKARLKVGYFLSQSTNLDIYVHLLLHLDVYPILHFKQNTASAKSIIF